MLVYIYDCYLYLTQLMLVQTIKGEGSCWCKYGALKQVGTEDTGGETSITEQLKQFVCGV